jgi:glutathione synthase
MRIAFLVNAIETEAPRFTTTLFALAAFMRGHDVAYLTPGDFVLRSDGRLMVRALTLPASKYKKVETLHKALQGDETKVVTMEAADIDVLMLRNDPSLDAEERPWAAQAGQVFGRLAAARGVLVVNDPDGISLAQNKLYFQEFPEVVRPAALISRDIEEIRAFIEEQPDGAIIKPLQGSGGKNVFKIDSATDANLNQIFEAVTVEGYLIAQSYIPEAAEGDVRLFVMNGSPLQRDGKFAAMRRVPARGELRSNMHVRGKAAKVEVDDRILALASLVRPKLVQDGLFLVGLDIVGDKVLEINVFTPGGLWSICDLHRIDFADSVIAALEAKLHLCRQYPGGIGNRALATL